MGYIKHHAIVITGSKDGCAKAHKLAKKIFKQNCSRMIHARINDTSSFFIGPDGSKEGWEDSNRGDQMRSAFIKEVSDPLQFDIDYCEIFYGEDNGNAEVVSHN